MATSKTPPSLALADTPSVLSTPDPRHPPTSRYQSLRDAAVHLRPRGDFTGQTFAVLVFNPAYDNTVGTYEESDPRNVWFTAKGSHTVAKIQKAYKAKGLGDVAIEYDGLILPESTTIRDLNYFGDNTIILIGHGEAEVPGARSYSRRRTDWANNLPVELRSLILDLLPVSDVKSMRLMSKDWAASGAPQLFKDFCTMFPHQVDFERLKQISHRPLIAKGVKNVAFVVTELHLDSFLEELSRSKQHRKMIERTIATSMALVRFRRYNVKDDADAKVSRFELLTKLLKRDTDYNEPLLQAVHLLPVLRRLHQLTTLTLRFTAFPAGPRFEEFQGAFEKMLRRNDQDGLVPEVPERRCTEVLTSLDTSNVKTLVLDGVSLELFRQWSTAIITASQADRIMTNFASGLEHVENLYVYFTDRYCVFMDSRGHDDEGSVQAALASFCRFFGCFKGLKALALSHGGIQSEQSHDLVERFASALFKTCRFPELERLRLDSIPGKWADLLEFLKAHSSTLKRLRLRSCVLLDYYHILTTTDNQISIAQFFTLLKNNLSLEAFEFRIWGMVDRDLYGSNTCFWEATEHLVESRAPSRMIERFVLEQIPWPMETEDPEMIWTGETHIYQWTSNSEYDESENTPNAPPHTSNDTGGVKKAGSISNPNMIREGNHCLNSGSEVDQHWFTVEEWDYDTDDSYDSDED